MNRNGGFTLVETLIALAVISIITLSSFSLFTRVMKFRGRITAANKLNIQSISLDQYLRSLVSRIQIPYWVDLRGEAENSRGKPHLNIPYLDGKRESFLVIEFSNDVLKVKTPEREREYSGWSGYEIKFLQNESSRISGVSLTLKHPGRRDTDIVCTFGAIGYAVFLKSKM